MQDKVNRQVSSLHKLTNYVFLAHTCLQLILNPICGCGWGGGVGRDGGVGVGLCELCSSLHSFDYACYVNHVKKKVIEQFMCNELYSL